MLVTLEIIWKILSLTDPSLGAMSITAGVGCSTWTTSVHNYDSILLARTLRMVVHYTCTGTLNECCFIGGLLGLSDCVIR